MTEYDPAAPAVTQLPAPALPKVRFARPIAWFNPAKYEGELIAFDVTAYRKATSDRGKAEVRVNFTVIGPDGATEPQFAYRITSARIVRALRDREPTARLVLGRIVRGDANHLDFPIYDLVQASAADYDLAERAFNNKPRTGSE